MILKENRSVSEKCYEKEKKLREQEEKKKEILKSSYEKTRDIIGEIFAGGAVGALWAWLIKMWGLPKGGIAEAAVETFLSVSSITQVIYFGAIIGACIGGGVGLIRLKTGKNFDDVLPAFSGGLITLILTTYILILTAIPYAGNTLPSQIFTFAFAGVVSLIAGICLGAIGMFVGNLVAFFIQGLIKIIWYTVI